MPIRDKTVGAISANDPHDLSETGESQEGCTRIQGTLANV